MLEIPKTFLIITLPAVTKSKLSFKNPPIIGTELEMAYFVALIDIPSYRLALNPWTLINIVKIVVNIPKTYFNMSTRKLIILDRLIHLLNPQHAYNIVKK